LTLTGGGSLRGSVRVPGDKSISHRALLFGAIGSAFGFYPVFVLNALMLVGGGTLHGRSAAKPTGDEAVKRDAQ
jgi:hypothetical protein